MRWFYEGSFYTNAILALITFVLVCTWKNKEGKTLLAWAMILYFAAPILFRVRQYLGIKDIIEWDSIAAVTIGTIGVLINTLSHVLFLCFAIVAGKSHTSLPKSQGDQPAEISGPMFLYIPIGRLVFMGIISLGIYDAYWIYKNWKFIKERDGMDIQPFWRGVFGIFFCHKLLRAIRDDQQANAIAPGTFSAGGLATGWVILVVVGNISGRIPDPIIALPFFFLVSLSFLFFIPVQNYINKVNESLNQPVKFNPWSTGHIVCLVLGVLFWPLVIIGFAAN
jgi:hypothetical protein